MAKRCDLCKRSATKGASRSHSKIQTLKRQNINLQTRNIGGFKLKICTSCLRTIAKKGREDEKKEEEQKIKQKEGQKVKPKAVKKVVKKETKKTSKK